MKINDVCKLTGLTERAVRFYVEKGLLDPSSRDVNGRRFREYSAQDVQRLRRVAALRAAGFAIEEIAGMQGDPARVNEAVKRRGAELAVDAGERARLAKRMEALPAGDTADWARLADALARDGEGRVSLEPDFGRLDASGPEDMSRGDAAKLQKYLASVSPGGQRKRSVIKAAAAVALAVCALAAGMAAYDGAREANLHVLITSVVFTDKYVVSGDGMYAYMYSTEGHNALDAGETVSLRFEDGALYNAVISRNEYPAATLNVSMTRAQARAEGLLGPDGALDMEKTLSDKAVLERYGSVISVQGDEY